MKYTLVIYAERKNETVICESEIFDDIECCYYERRNEDPFGELGFAIYENYGTEEQEHVL